MPTGKLVQFDDARGYGFITPDSGGEDVFVHVNDFRGDRHLVQAGITVEYEAAESDRGLKALSAHVLKQAPARTASSNSATGEDETMCDILTPVVMRREVTELLLTSVPTLTAAQIVQVRDCVVELGQRHGWIES